MTAVSENFRELSEKLGGFNPHALDSFLYWNNPLTLKHWTMNAVEIVMCVGAILALLHALRAYRHTKDATYLCFWLISIGYLFVVEVPLYFPTLVGEDPTMFRFLHNEFTAGLFYDRTPLYIVALYPALTYPAYVLIETTGIFERQWGLLPGAISVGFLHHCFYEIFDHFGPQYGWWVWNYDMYGATIASVPLASIYTFAFIGPLGLTLVTRLLITRYLNLQKSAATSPNSWHLAGLCIAASFAAFVPLVVLSPDLYYKILLSAMPDPHIEKAVSLSIVCIAGLVALATCLNVTPAPSRESGKKRDIPGKYPLNFLAFYLAAFAALWIYALPEYMSAINGFTERGTPIGSLGYTIACFGVCLVFPYLIYRSTRKNAGNINSRLDTRFQRGN